MGIVVRRGLASCPQRKEPSWSSPYMSEIGLQRAEQTFAGEDIIY